jgi:hypothetical protein
MKHLAFSVMAISCALFSTAVAADTFEVKLGDKVLGSLVFNQTANSITLKSTLNNTPLGVFNGTFQAASQVGGASARQFESISKSSRKTRQIKFIIRDGKADEVVITPSKERTDISDPSKAPRGVIDPAQGIATLITAQGCPTVFTMYDGRRAMRVTPSGTKESTDTLVCSMNYKVIAGPGHLSPLYVSSAKISAQYNVSAGQQTLTSLNLSSGPFKLSLGLVD